MAKGQFEDTINEALKTGKTTEVIKALEEKLLGRKVKGRVDPNSELRGKLDYIVRDNILRSRNFSRIERFSAVGVTRLEIVAVMDKKTSHICIAMHGKTIEVSKAVSWVREFVADDPARSGFWQERKNPTESQAEAVDLKRMTGDEAFELLGNKMPPYHPRCRTTVVASFDVTNKMASTEKRPDDRVLTDKEKAQSKALQEIAKKTIAKEVDYSDVDPIIAGKINSSLENLLGKKSSILPEKLEFINSVKSNLYYMMVEGNNKFYIGNLKRKETADWVWENSNTTKDSGFYKFSISHLPKENALQGIIDHEIGHIIHNSLGKNHNKLFDRWNKLYKKIGKKNIKSKLSEYAMKDEIDFFAESYSLYKNNGTKVLDDLSGDIVTLFKEVDQELLK